MTLNQPKAKSRNSSDSSEQFRKNTDKSQQAKGTRMHLRLGSEERTYETHLGKLNLYDLENEL